ncbi:hypothetical protein [Kamptonema sp. PCC 6506]
MDASPRRRAKVISDFGMMGK